MSIPLVQDNEKDSINTSLIAIKRSIERINALLGLADSSGSSPDLSGLATKQELQDVVNSLQPVDEVTLDNMQSVTSNAVAKANSYSTTELKTGGVWTNNKPIYRYYINADVSQSTINNSSWDLSSLNIQDIVSIKALGYGTNDQYVGWYPIDGLSLSSESSGNNNFVRTVFTSNQNIIVRVNGAGSGLTQLNILKVRIAIEYTKTTD